MPPQWSQAVAYLKAQVPESDPARVVSVDGDEAPVIRILGSGLLVTYVIDVGDSFDYVQIRHLRSAGVTEEELHRIAVNNLYGLAEKHLRVQPYGDVFALFMEGNFEASVLLLDTVWDVSLAKHVKGEFLAAAPTRDVLAFGDSSSPTVPGQLRGVVDRVLASGPDHPLSARLLCRRSGTWEPDAA